jgi:hypothetical protein
VITVHTNLTEMLCREQQRALATRTTVHRREGRNRWRSSRPFADS